MAALAIASRSLSRELTGEARYGRPDAHSPVQGPEAAPTLSLAPTLSTALAAVGT